MRGAIRKRFSGERPARSLFFAFSFGSSVAGRVLVRAAKRRACLQTSTRPAVTRDTLERL